MGFAGNDSCRSFFSWFAIDMSYSHLIRVGAFGSIGQFVSVDASVYRRETRVICRTDRGLEVGQVLAPLQEQLAALPDGTLLRKMTESDELLQQRLEKNKQQALNACLKELDQQGIHATLIDVEHLFDGKSIFFYFLGEVTSEVEAITGKLAKVYEAEVQFHQFAKTLSEGCGPDCGTEKAAGCGDGCSSCTVAVACKAKR